MNTHKVLLFSIGPVGAAVIGGITIPILSWFFGVEDIGRLAILQASVSLTLLLFTLGLDQAFIREYHEADNKPELFKTALMPGLGLLVFVGGVLVLWPGALSEMLFGINSALLASLFLLSTVFAFHSRFLALILRMQERGMAFSMSQLWPKLVFLVVCIFYVWASKDVAFENLAFSYTVSLLAGLLVLVFYTRSYWAMVPQTSVDKQKLKQMLKYAWPLVGSGLAFWGLIAMDKFFLRILSSFEELGVYSVAVSLAGVALVFKAILSTVWAPTVFKWAASEAGPEPNKVKSVIDLVTLAVIFIWSMFGIFSWFISFLLPPVYDHIHYVLLAALAYPLLYTLSEVTGAGINLKRKTIYNLLAVGLALLVNMTGNYVLIPLYGAEGAATSTAIAFLVFFLIKTELSSLFWVSFERLRMHVFVLVATFMSVWMALQPLSVIVVVLIWFVFLLSGVAAYQKEALKIYLWVRGKVEKD